jgi:hypothetical protein
MKLSEFKTQLGTQPAAHVVISLPDGGVVPRHFHVTEVGHVAKKFGAAESCVLQTWTASDHDDGHRLTAGKLQFILGLADSILPSGDLPVEVEFEAGVISQFPVDEITFDGSDLTVHLGSKHTDCLARERCGVKGGEAGGEETGAEAGCCAGATGSGSQRCC